MTYRRWIHNVLIVPTSIITFILLFDLIVDPYSMTPYNLLDIKNKFARDDRAEKVARLTTSPAFDNLLMGSSRVYSTNPSTLSRYLGGSTYNAGVGTARMEDHLGLLLMLERLGRLPKHIVLGIDFYTFNPELETNKYFTKNRDLNFLHETVSAQEYLDKFISIDAFRAAIKTFRNHLNDLDRPMFDKNGVLSDVVGIVGSHPPRQSTKSDDDAFTQEGLQKELREVVKTHAYPALSQARLGYLERFVEICQKHDIKLYLYLTPHYGELLSLVQADSGLNTQLKALKKELAKRTPFYDFMRHDAITDSRAYFYNPTHGQPWTGNLILARIFEDGDVEMPDEFGSYVPLRH